MAGDPSPAPQAERKADPAAEVAADEGAHHSIVRWLAYLSRVKAIAARSVGNISLRAGPARYFAFTSDVGEAFRPAVPSWVVNFSYATSVAYIGGAVAESGYSAHSEGKPWKDVQETIAREATFQLLASLFLPFLVIHTAVHRTVVMLKARNLHQTRPMLARWAPSAVGLACIPVLPVAVDKPVEHGVEVFFDKFVHQDTSLATDFRRYHKECLTLEALWKHNNPKVE